MKNLNKLKLLITGLIFGVSLLATSTLNAKVYEENGKQFIKVKKEMCELKAPVKNKEIEAENERLLNEIEKDVNLFVEKDFKTLSGAINDELYAKSGKKFIQVRYNFVCNSVFNEESLNKYNSLLLVSQDKLIKSAETERSLSKEDNVSHRIKYLKMGKETAAEHVSALKAYLN